MTKPLTLMTVHGHPDDESIGTGGLLAKTASEGIRTVLVSCTMGEVGEISDPSLATPENLGIVRRQELEEACRILRVSHLETLGYRDSGMMGTPDNNHPASFWQADFDEAVGRLVRLIRLYQPEVVVTYDENGFYGHPDHIQANRVTVAAIEAAADPDRYREQGLEPWTVLKLYYTAIGKSRLREAGQRLAELGLLNRFIDEEGEPTLGVPDEAITATIDVSAEVATKHRALMAHRTQMTDVVYFHKLPVEGFYEMYGRETFTLVKSQVPTAEHESDLFEGLRAG